ncbi:MAG: DUF5674 family protein [Clostridiales bacterium]|jgi:hypothetical protein|nr:DUF5674 family protein [Clostridiales bacterium]
MKIVNEASVSELEQMSKNMYEPMVKAVIDVRRRIIAIDGGLHADEELYLLLGGSEQKDLWGINLWPSRYGSDSFIEFDSMINMRPDLNNFSRSVDDEKIRELIKEIVGGIVHAG